MSRGAARAAFTWTPVGRTHPTVAGLDLTVHPGERVLLLGRSGSGKSTVLHALAGALGTSLPGDLTGEIAVAGRIGFVPQNPSDGVVAERIGSDVAFGPENLGLDRDEIWRRVREALAAVGLPYPTQHLTSALSGGEQQRLSLAGVLALQPDLMLLDEPTSMLDDETARQVRDAVLGVVGDRTMIVVEHRFEPWLAHVDRVIVLEGGQIVSDTGPQDLPMLAGLWHPDSALPEVRHLPAALVTPIAGIGEVVLADIAVDIVSRTLRGSQRMRAVDGVSARFEAGRLTAVTGRSGSGKSTALLAAAGLVRPVRGSVTPDRRTVRSRDLARGLGWVPQNPEHGFLASSVDAEVQATAQRLGRSVDVEAVLSAMGLEHLPNSHPYRLSGGEQRRLAMVAGLAHRPGFLVLDEPTVGQDPDSWALVTGWMRAAATAGATVVFSTHDSAVPRDAEIRLVSR